ncbi:MAG TPA: hypothetical protein VF493_02835 [Terriglobales bacterium]
MRIYEGDHAYEIEQILNPETQVRSGWRYKVYRVRPAEQVLRTGEAPSRDEAEKAGKQALAEVLRDERQTSGKKPAA